MTNEQQYAEMQRRNAASLELLKSKGGQVTWELSGRKQTEQEKLASPHAGSAYTIKDDSPSKPTPKEQPPPAPTPQPAPAPVPQPNPTAAPAPIKSPALAGLGAAGPSQEFKPIGMGAAPTSPLIPATPAPAAGPAGAGIIQLGGMEPGPGFVEGGIGGNLRALGQRRLPEMSMALAGLQRLY